MLTEALRSGAELKTVLVRRGFESGELVEAGGRAGRSDVLRGGRAVLPRERGGNVRRTLSFPAMQPQWDGRRRSMTAGAGTAARRLAGPGQPWHDPADGRGVRPRSRSAVRGLCRSVFAQGRRARRWARCSACRACTLPLAEAARPAANGTVCRSTRPRCTRTACRSPRVSLGQGRRHHRQ